MRTVRPVLVTGSNRSGTTWVGRMLCESKELAYVHEPFNPGVWPRWMPRPVPFRNLYVCADNEAAYVEPVRRVLQRRIPVRAQLREAGSPRRLATLAARWTAARPLGRRPTLVKDPIAFFSSEWLADRFAMNVVVMIRHPLAFAGSIKRLGWAFNFRNWLDQELLMRGLLAPFAAEIEAMAGPRQDLVDQAILLWKAHYHVADRFRATRPDWSFVHFEELASAPVDGYRDLYRELGLRFDDRVARRIAAFSDAANVKDVPAGDPGTIKRDSKAAITTWQQRLSPEEVARIRRGVASVAERFYEAAAWQSD